MRWSWTLVVAVTVAIGHAAPQDRPARGEQRPTKNPLEGNAQAISNGGAMFRTRCAGCHGPDARGYVGPDLTGVWLAGNTDDHLFDIVRHGIPGTEMTPADPLRVNDRDIWQVSRICARSAR
jgi:mono/diheme cytochrome c family protein